LPDGADDYALVFFEGFDVRAVVVFPRETLGRVCVALKKRHPNQEKTLQLTQANFNNLIGHAEKFDKLEFSVLFLREPANRSWRHFAAHSIQTSAKSIDLAPVKLKAG
jgi:hypothetical protein